MATHVKVGELALDANGVYIANLKAATAEVGAAEKVGTIKDYRSQANGGQVRGAKDLGIYRIGNDIAFIQEGRWIDDVYHTQKSVFDANKNIIANASNNAKGAWGEIGSDVAFTEKGFEYVHRRKRELTEGWGETGIDAIFRKEGQYYIVEAKYTGSATLKMTDDGLQLSDTWIMGSNRLENVVGATLANEIRAVGYRRIWSKIAPDGTVTFKEVDALGNVIRDFIP
jgi:hypothetical protein